MLARWLFLSILLCFKFSFSQQIAFIDEQTKQPIKDVMVVVTSLESKKTYTYFSSDKGVVILSDFEHNDLPLLIVNSSIYFKTFADTLETLNSSYNIKTEVFNLFDEVIVTAQYKPQIVENAVHQVKVINSEKIQAMGAQNLRDVFTNQLNIRIAQDFALGSSMSLQGVSGQNVKILIDGVPLTGRLNGNIDISQINMNNVERIEIIEGPLSVSYGTDALAGTINIITKKESKDKLSIGSTNYYESVGNYNNTMNLGWSNSKNNINLATTRNYFDGWNSTDPNFMLNPTRIADSSRFQEWKPKEQMFGTFNYTRKFSKGSINYTSDYFWEEVVSKGRPRAPYFENAFDDYFKTTRFNNSIHFKQELKNTSTNEESSPGKIAAFVAFNHFKRIKNTFFRDLTTLEDQLSTSTGAQDTSIFNNFMSRGTFSNTTKSQKIKYEIGYDINRETGIGERILNSRQVIGDYALFSTAEINFTKNLTLRPGLRAIHNTAYKAPVIPSINVKYTALDNLEKRRKLTLRGSYARGFRAPDLKELYFFFVDINHNIQGNPTLTAENSHNYSFAATYIQRKNKFGYKLHLNGFYNQINHQISLAQSSPTAFSYFNIDRFETTGGQLNTEWVINALKINAGASYIGRYNQFHSNEESSINQRFIFSPESQLNISYTLKKWDMSVSTFYKLTGKMPLVRTDEDGVLTTTIIDGFSTLDATLTKNFFAKKMSTTIGAKNIFNVTNINGFMPGGAHSGGSNTMAVAMGRTFFIALTIQLSKN